MSKYPFKINEVEYEVEGTSVTIMTRKASAIYAEKGFPQDYNLLYNRILTHFRSKAGERTPRAEREVKPFKLNFFNVAGRKLKDYYSGGKALIKNVSGQVVSQEEVNRRQKLCLQCPMRVQATDCVGCGAAGKASSLADRAKKFLGHHTLKLAKTLEMGGCGICGCTFQLLLPALFEDLHDDTPEQREKRQEQAPHCWMLEKPLVEEKDQNDAE